MAVSKQNQNGVGSGHIGKRPSKKARSLSPYVLFFLVCAIGYSSYACGRAYGWTGLFVYLGALLALVVSGQIIPEGGVAGMPIRALVYGAYVLAALCGLLGVGKRAAALKSAGTKPPKSG